MKNKKGGEIMAYPKSITIDGVVFVPQSEMAEDEELGKYVIVRTCSAGVFAGYLESRKGQEVVLRKARRIWYWDGAASLSQLAMEGTKKPENCKFPCEVERVELLQSIEILDCTKEAQKSIMEVKVWKI